MSDLEESSGFFEDKNVHVTTISTDKLDNLNAMIEEKNLFFSLLADVDFRHWKPMMFAITKKMIRMKIMVLMVSMPTSSLMIKVNYFINDKQDL
ncbi:hypothetical protein [Pseudalkalibacillus hwajinpoensis]|uniref:hypothetical protein n=1 Tax=Guptibacillus hwajinpoensis TaxID=208199 RepID=UPI0034E4EB7C